jgi:predicted metal-binding protein
MSKPLVHVFLCTGKDCAKAWRRLCNGSAGKWLKRRAEEAGLPYKLNIIKTECMDCCDDAACLCFQRGREASFEINVRAPDDADRLLAALRACVERSDQALPQRSAS